MSRQAVHESEILDLADAAVEGRLTRAQLSRLEELVTSDSRAARVYIDYVSIHASLRVTNGTPIQLPTSTSSVVCGNSDLRESVDSGPKLTSWPAISTMQMALLALAVFMGLAVGFWFAAERQPPTLAVLSETKECKWGAGTLPTSLGSRLTVGRLRLVEGLARIVFENGVDMQLESPADLELVSTMKCIVHSGKLIASVPPNAKGFVVETPSSIVTDYGTEFGVSVSSDQSAVVQVFQGRVDTFHRPTGKTEVMKEGSVFFFGNASYGPQLNVEQSLVSDANKVSESGSLDRLSNRLQISTAHGRGRDCYLQPQEFIEKNRSETLLLVKRPFPAHASYERIAYLGFDLAEVGRKRIAEAELHLSFAPTGLGFASLVPDATFYVYGLLDQQLDDWSERQLTWENAPALGAQQLDDDSKIVFLGSFQLAQGNQSSTVSMTGQPLSDFLNADVNQLATLIVVRETIGEGPSDLVHGFASRRHPTLQPPSLRLTLSDR